MAVQVALLSPVAFFEAVTVYDSHVVRKFLKGFFEYSRVGIILLEHAKGAGEIEAIAETLVRHNLEGQALARYHLVAGNHGNHSFLTH